MTKSLVIACLLSGAAASGNLRGGHNTNPKADDRSLQVPSKRIVNGDDALSGDYPWFASMHWSGNDRWAGCGATLVGPKHVVSAAHCFEASLNPARYSVKIGALCGRNDVDNEHDNNDEGCDQASDYVGVSAIDILPGFVRAIDGLDLAVLTLERPTQTEYIKPDDGSVVESLVNGDFVRALGFGKTSNLRDSFSNKLQEVNLNYINNVECQLDFDNDGFGEAEIKDDMLCTLTPGKDTCQGDSGGPIVREQGGSYTLVGATSWGVLTCAAGSPGVSARISEHYEFIEGIVCGGGNEQDMASWCPGYTETTSTTRTPGTDVGPSTTTSTPAETITSTPGSTTTTAPPADIPTTTTTTTSVILSERTCEDEKGSSFQLINSPRTCQDVAAYHPLIRDRVCSVSDDARILCPLSCAGQC